jgi:hypothetical protein
MNEVNMATEFTILTEDRPGSLADLAEVLAKSAINIVAIHATPCPTSGIVQFITSNSDATVAAFGEARIDYTVREVLLLTPMDQPGLLARLARALGNADININSLYVTMGGQIVLDVSDLRKAQQVAMGMGIK